MSRKIKFRSWNPQMKRMSYGRELQHIGLQFSIERDSLAVLNMVSGEDVDEVLMQFTGILDQTGREIYEGDILKVAHLPLGVAQWGGHSAGFVYKHSANSHEYHLQKSQYFKPEVIGNIYENPELLKS